MGMQNFFADANRVVVPVVPSKHAALPFEGRCVIDTNSGLRKRMRGVRRGFYAVTLCAKPTSHVHPRHLRSTETI